MAATSAKDLYPFMVAFGQPYAGNPLDWPVGRKWMVTDGLKPHHGVGHRGAGWAAEYRGHRLVVGVGVVVMMFGMQLSGIPHTSSSRPA
ncbi:hypothetical protein LX36DRAFT_78908 [Colletotrichum falcatum]|nr:hypothetical protein LX36DRAFT_78908 [Colletotrichum falcatum]